MYNVAFDCKCGMEHAIEVESGVESTITCFSCNREHSILMSSSKIPDDEAELEESDTLEEEADDEE